MKLNAKISTVSKARARTYRQKARAAAAKASETRVLDAFRTLLTERWLDGVTLDAVAAEAGVTVQTVIRKFGGKEGLLEALVDRLKDEVTARRQVGQGAVDAILHALIEDYEASGDLVMRLLNQEERYPLLTPFLNLGRAHHRNWVATVFAPWLAPLEGPTRARTTDALVCATDLYLWKLLRRDFGYAPAHVADVMHRLVTGLLTTLEAGRRAPVAKARKATD